MILTVPAAAERVRPLVRRPMLWLAGAYYLVGAVALTMWLWRDPASRIVAGNPYDADQFAWFFRYDATAVAHLDRKSTRLNSSHALTSRMPSSA